MRTDEKARLRQQAKAQREREDPVLAATDSQALSQRLAAFLQERRKTRVAAFYPLPGEVDLRGLLTELAQDETLYLPRLAAGRTLTFHRVTSLTTLFPGPFTLRQPEITNEEVPSDFGHLDSDAIIVPGLLFDLQGGRLGFGAGYYDRFLASKPRHLLRIAVCFNRYIVSRLPMHDHDCRMDFLCTESALHRCVTPE